LETTVSEDDRVLLRRALARTESMEARSPSFETVWARIEQNPSPMDAPRWSLSRSAHLAWRLVLAQFHIVPWLVIPVMLLSSALALGSARWLSVAQDAHAASTGFVSVILLGVITAATFAISIGRDDTLTASTPVGASAVLAARVTGVLGLNLLCALATSIAAVSTGLHVNLGELVLGWLAPALVTSGLVTLVGIWSAPWAGAALGILVGVLLTPLNDGGGEVGMGAVISAIRVALPAPVLIALGVALLIASIASARFAENRLPAESV
jgi:hypothetical protein